MSLTLAYVATVMVVAAYAPYVLAGVVIACFGHLLVVLCAKPLGLKARPRLALAVSVLLGFALVLGLWGAFSGFRWSEAWGLSVVSFIGVLIYWLTIAATGPARKRSTAGSLETE